MALEIKQLDADSITRWDAFVETCPAATFFHRAGWRGVIERSFGHRAYYLYAETGGRIHGVLPLVHIRSRLFGNALISNAFCVEGGPVAADEAALRALDARACALAESLDVDHLEYRSRARRHPDWPCNDMLYVGFRKEIDSNDETNMRAIPRKQRAMVRKGIKAGLSSEIDRGIERAYAIYAESVHRLGTPVFSRAYFAALVEEFGDACDVLTVTHRGRPLSSVISFYFRDEVIPYYGGGGREARRFAANDFMYWELMRRAVARGCRVFDFGRSKRGTGSFAFKKNWGFAPEPLYHEFRLRRGSAIPEINPLNPKYRLFISLWRKLPLSVANRLGPFIARDLG